MLFPTLNFALFLLLILPLSWALRGRQQTRLLFLTAASYGFYACWDWRFCGLLAASSLGNWWVGRQLHRCTSLRGRRRWLAAAVTINLTVLGFFKYYGFFLDSLNQLLVDCGATRELPYLSVILPVGISFFTFHGLSYIIDIERGKLTRPASILQMLLYISFFPQLVAGPIVRAAQFLPQLTDPVDATAIPVVRSLLLIVGGLFKKVVLANSLATGLVDGLFFDPTGHGAWDHLLGAYGYAVQIYCDFSAYTDIAIGVAALFGYRFPRNFNQPYRSAGLREFWRRWHMSLSSWLRDYLYISLGGNRGRPWQRDRNVLVTMLLGGLWHGAAWKYMVWGALHGTMLVGEHRLFGDREIRDGRPWQRWLAVLLTFHAVCLTWIVFRAADLQKAWDYLLGFRDWRSAPTVATPFVVTLLAFGFLTQWLPEDRVARLERWVCRWPWPI